MKVEPNYKKFYLLINQKLERTQNVLTVYLEDFHWLDN